MAADDLLEVLSSPSKGHRRGSQAAISLVEDLCAGSLAEIVRRQEREPRAFAVSFTHSELSILREALESYWFDCDVGEDDELSAKQRAVEALSAKIDQIRQRRSQPPSTYRSSDDERSDGH